MTKKLTDISSKELLRRADIENEFLALRMEALQSVVTRNACEKSKAWPQIWRCKNQWFHWPGTGTPTVKSKFGKVPHSTSKWFTPSASFYQWEPALRKSDEIHPPERRFGKNAGNRSRSRSLVIPPCKCQTCLSGPLQYLMKQRCISPQLPWKQTQLPIATFCVPKNRPEKPFQ